MAFDAAFWTLTGISGPETLSRARVQAELTDLITYLEQVRATQDSQR